MDRFLNHLNQAVWAESEKNWPGQGQILYFVSGRAGFGPKFEFPFRAGPGRNFFSLFRAKIVAKRAGPGPV